MDVSKYFSSQQKQNKLTRVLVTLEHELGSASGRVPELHAAVLATRHDPLAIRRLSDTEDEVLVTLEGLDALAALRLAAGAVVEASVVELPHLDRLVKRAGNQVAPIGGEGDTVDTILVSLLAFGTLDQDTGLSVPNADALVQAAGCDEAVVGGDSDGSDAVFDVEGEDASVLLNVPQPDSAVARAGGNVAAIRGEIQGVNVLLVTRELVENLLGRDIPDLKILLDGPRHNLINATYADDLVLSTSGQVSAVGTEADASDVKVTILVGSVVGQMADLLTRDNVEDLG